MSLYKAVSNMDERRKEYWIRDGEIPNCATVLEIPNSSTTSSMHTDQNADPVYIATVTMQMTAVTVHFVAVGQFIGFFDQPFHR